MSRRQSIRIGSHTSTVTVSSSVRKSIVTSTPLTTSETHESLTLNSFSEHGSPQWISGSDMVFKTPKFPTALSRRSTIHNIKKRGNDMDFKIPTMMFCSPPGVKTRARRSSIQVSRKVTSPKVKVMKGKMTKTVTKGQQDKTNVKRAGKTPSQSKKRKSKITGEKVSLTEASLVVSPIEKTSGRSARSKMAHSTKKSPATVSRTSRVVESRKSLSTTSNTSRSSSKSPRAKSSPITKKATPKLNQRKTRSKLDMTTVREKDLMDVVESVSLSQTQSEGASIHNSKSKSRSPTPRASRKTPAKKGKSSARKVKATAKKRTQSPTSRKSCGGSESLMSMTIETSVTASPSPNTDTTSSTKAKLIKRKSQKSPSPSKSTTSTKSPRKSVSKRTVKSSREETSMQVLEKSMTETPKSKKRASPTKKATLKDKGKTASSASVRSKSSPSPSISSTKAKSTKHKSHRSPSPSKTTTPTATAKKSVTKKSAKSMKKRKSEVYSEGSLSIEIPGMVVNRFTNESSHAQKRKSSSSFKDIGSPPSAKLARSSTKSSKRSKSNQEETSMQVPEKSVTETPKSKKRASSAKKATHKCKGKSASSSVRYKSRGSMESAQTIKESSVTETPKRSIRVETESTPISLHQNLKASTSKKSSLSSSKKKMTPGQKQKQTSSSKSSKQSQSVKVMAKSSPVAKKLETKASTPRKSHARKSISGTGSMNIATKTTKATTPKKTVGSLSSESQIVSRWTSSLTSDSLKTSVTPGVSSRASLSTTKTSVRDRFYTPEEKSTISPAGDWRKSRKWEESQGTEAMSQLPSRKQSRYESTEAEKIDRIISSVYKAESQKKLPTSISHVSHASPARSAILREADISSLTGRQSLNRVGRTITPSAAAPKAKKLLGVFDSQSPLTMTSTEFGRDYGRKSQKSTSSSSMFSSSASTSSKAFSQQSGTCSQHKGSFFERVTSSQGEKVEEGKEWILLPSDVESSMDVSAIEEGDETVDYSRSANVTLSHTSHSRRCVVS